MRESREGVGGFEGYIDGEPSREVTGASGAVLMGMGDA